MAGDRSTVCSEIYRGDGGRTMSLLNHLVSPEHQRLGDRQAERLGSLEVNDQLEFRRLLHGQVSGLGTLENLVHVGSGASEQVGVDRAVGHQAASLRILSQRVHRWQAALRRKVYQPYSVSKEQNIP